MKQLSPRHHPAARSRLLVCTGSLAAVFCSAVAAAVVTFAELARAAESCTLSGDAVMPRNVSLYDAKTGGNEIARFTGAKIGLTVSAFPDDVSGRATIETSGFRIKGFVRGGDLPIYTARAVPVFAGHLWLAAARRVAVAGTAAGRVRVQKYVTTPLVGLFQGWAPCDALTLTERTPAGWAPSGEARGFVLKKDQAELFTEPRGDTVMSVERASDGPGVLLWSDDRQGAWVHVEHHSDVVIDAWARAQDLTPLPPGETMDQLAPSVVQTGLPSLRVQGNTKVVRVPGIVALRASASDAAATIGSLDAGVEVLVLDTVAGWASVVPKDLGLAPAGENQFWARAKDLGP